MPHSEVFAEFPERSAGGRTETHRRLITAEPRYPALQRSPLRFGRSKIAAVSGDIEAFPPRKSRAVYSARLIRDRFARRL